MSIRATNSRLLPEKMQVGHVSADPGLLIIHAESAEVCARCPDCGRRTERVHSRYRRPVADLPWRGIAVDIRISARRFFCDELACKRRIFCERLPEAADSQVLQEPVAERVGARRGCPGLPIGRILPTNQATAMRRALHESVCPQGLESGSGEYYRNNRLHHPREDFVCGSPRGRGVLGYSPDGSSREAGTSARSSVAACRTGV